MDGDQTAELIQMLALFALPALIVGYLIVRLLVKLIGHRGFRRFLWIVAFLAAAFGGILSIAFVSQPSMALALLPATLIATGAGLGGLVASMRGTR